VTEPEDDWFDPDIAAMNLGYGEKAGLQIYRNYTRSFEEYAIRKFVETIDLEQLDLSNLQHLTKLIISEDERFLPVIVCAFADNVLKDTFMSALPSGIPGGKGSMFGGYGPLSDLSKRIQLAYAFDILSPDLMEELDHLRSARNVISHSWDIKSLNEFYTKGHLAKMHRIEELLSDREEPAKDFSGVFKPLAAFRVRLVWIVGRLIYEAAAYNRAKKARLRPTQALYGKPAPKWLKEISKIALEASREIAKQNE
jgi:hypothetical protein